MPSAASSRGQALLTGAESTLRVPAGLRGVGRDHIDAEPAKGAPKLRGMALVDLAAGLRRVPVMAAAIGVERANRPLAAIASCTPRKLKAVPSSSTNQHRVMLAGGIVHGHDQVPVAARHPPMAAAVLVQHHARQGRALAALAMLAAARRTGHQTGRLQPVLDPGVASTAAVAAAVEAVEMLHVPALVALAVQRLQPKHLVDRGARATPGSGACPLARPSRPRHTDRCNAGTSARALLESHLPDLLS